MGNRGDGLDIDDNAAGVGEALDENGFCPGGDRRLEVGWIMRVNKGAVPAEPLEREGELGQRPAVEIA